MAVVATDIVWYGSANMPEDDNSVAGGAIDTTTRVVFTRLVTPSVISIQSSSAGDTEDILFTGRLVGGALATETITLAGQSVVSGTTTFERILKWEVQNTGVRAGTVTVSNSGGAMATMLPTEDRYKSIFMATAADVLGGSQRIYYEKIFVKNNNGTDTLSSAFVEEQGATTVEAKTEFDLEDALNDSDQTTNRLTEPAGYTFDSAQKAVAGGNLTNGAAQGVWLKLTLAAGDPAVKGTYTMRTSGTTV